MKQAPTHAYQENEQCNSHEACNVDYANGDFILDCDGRVGKIFFSTDVERDGNTSINFYCALQHKPNTTIPQDLVLAEDFCFDWIPKDNILAKLNPNTVGLFMRKYTPANIIKDEEIENLPKISHTSRKWKYSEDKILKQLAEYIDSTYSQHYGGEEDKLQALELIISEGHGTGFLIGDIIKYAARYGKKDGYNRKDLMKILHYSVIMLHVHDLEER